MVILPVLINKKPVIVISSAVAILCLLVKTRWIMIAESHSTLRESREAFYQEFPAALLPAIALLALVSFFVLLRRQRTISSPFTKLLNTFCLAILGIYIFLEVWQFL